MRKHGLIVCILCPCLPEGPTNSERMHNIATTVLQRKNLQTELILWICLVCTSDYVLLIYFHM
jgi:hypothetical protein